LGGNGTLVRPRQRSPSGSSRSRPNSSAICSVECTRVLPIAN
jgi:hypothetical protein